MAVMACLQTRCGCTKHIAIPNRQPNVQIAMLRRPFAFSDEALMSQPIADIRTFEYRYTNDANISFYFEE